MRHDELNAFLTSVRHKRLLDYLNPMGETAQDAFERRLSWARVSQHDPEFSDEARFLLRYADALREVLTGELEEDDWVEETHAGGEWGAPSTVRRTQTPVRDRVDSVQPSAVRSERPASKVASRFERKGAAPSASPYRPNSDWEEDEDDVATRITTRAELDEIAPTVRVNASDVAWGAKSGSQEPSYVQFDETDAGEDAPTIRAPRTVPSSALVEFDDQETESPTANTDDVGQHLEAQARESVNSEAEVVVGGWLDSEPSTTPSPSRARSEPPRSMDRFTPGPVDRQVARRRTPAPPRRTPAATPGRSTPRSSMDIRATRSEPRTRRRSLLLAGLAVGFLFTLVIGAGLGGVLLYPVISGSEGWLAATDQNLLPPPVPIEAIPSEGEGEVVAMVDEAAAPAEGDAAAAAAAAAPSVARRVPDPPPPSEAERPTPVATAPAPAVAPEPAPAPAPVAAPPPRPAPAPRPKPTVAPRPAPAPAPAPVVAASAPEATPTEGTAEADPGLDVRGLWIGAGDGRSFKLTVRSQSGPNFSGMAELQMADGQWTTLTVTGKVAAGGAMSFRGGNASFNGSVKGMRAFGTFTLQPGTTPKSWSVIR
ncbi:MAG: hypothetical protein KTR31_23045 [Myxococcales bacterium]|nr:hypothetical protein [Myxococcales bacterium]